MRGKNIRKKLCYFLPLFSLFRIQKYFPNKAVINRPIKKEKGKKGEAAKFPSLIIISFFSFRRLSLDIGAPHQL